MRLSERGAIKSAIAMGGFHLYPAGKLLNIIQEGLSGDNLQGDFQPETTVTKIKSVSGPADKLAGNVFEKDKTLLIERILKINPEYDIDSVFDKMAEALPKLAKKYYGIEDFEPIRPSVVDYYFEGHSDVYKNADWSAFNVNSVESKELSVPVGIYFKKSQVTPGMPEYVTMHETNHMMQEKVATPNGYHHYIPWFDEGFADVFGKMMLFRATEDENMLLKLRYFRCEIDIMDQRKVTYSFGEETALLTLMRARLPFTKALMTIRKENTYDLDWNKYANLIKQGHDPHVAVLKAYTGKKIDTFRKKIERSELKFRNEGDLDQMDLRIISLFLSSEAPAKLKPLEYNACIWIADEIKKRPCPHFVDPEIIPEKYRAKIADYTIDAAIPADKIPAEAWEKAPEISVKILVEESAVPEQFKQGLDKLSDMYFVIKRKIGDKFYYEPYGGGLPYRFGTGEIRCDY